MTRPCPRCGRGNAAHKASCLYCGAALPDPAPPPMVTARELPPELDSLVADALSGRGGPPTRGIQRIKEALQAAPLVPLVEDRIGQPSPVSPEASHPLPEGEGESPISALPAALARAEEALATLRGAESVADPGAAHAAAAALVAAAAEILRLLPPPEEEPPAPVERPVVLPPVRLGFALVISGLNAADRAPELASALGVDVATARMLAGTPYLRVAMRGADPEALRAAAVRLQVQGIGASVLARESVAALPHPTLVVSARSGEPWRGLALGPLWEGDPEAIVSARGDPLPDPTPTLAVLGEVSVVRARAAQERSRMLRAKSSNDPRRLDEQRLGVIDLWGEGLHLRLIEGLTRVDAPEGRAPFRAFMDGLAERFPGLQIEARRICRPDERTASGPPGETIAQTGWPVFDEHTRMVWLHRMS